MKRTDPIPVFELFPDTVCQTRVWMSVAAAESIESDCDDKPVALMKKLKMLAEGGFRDFEGEEHVLVRHEGNGVYRVRHKFSSRFRMIGFYVGAGKSEFVILDAFLKAKADKYSSGQRTRIERVAAVRDSESWRRSK